MGLLDPIRLHNAAMNHVDQANRSNSFVLFKMAEQSSANALAVLTSIYAAGYFAGKLLLSIPATIVKLDLTIIRLIIRDDRPNLLYHELPNCSDCLATALRALKLWLGIWTSVAGVFVLGSQYNAMIQRKVGNCDRYESEYRDDMKLVCSEMAKKIEDCGEFENRNIMKPVFEKVAKIKADEYKEIDQLEESKPAFTWYDIPLPNEIVQDPAYPRANGVPLKELKPDPTLRGTKKYGALIPAYYKPLSLEQSERVDEYWKSKFKNVVMELDSKSHVFVYPEETSHSICDPNNKLHWKKMDPAQNPNLQPFTEMSEFALERNEAFQELDKWTQADLIKRAKFRELEELIAPNIDNEKINHEIQVELIINQFMRDLDETYDFAIGRLIEYNYTDLIPNVDALYNQTLTKLLEIHPLISRKNDQFLKEILKEMFVGLEKLIPIDLSDVVLD